MLFVLDTKCSPKVKCVILIYNIVDWRIATICSVVVAAMLVAGGFVLR